CDGEQPKGQGRGGALHRRDNDGRHQRDVDCDDKWPVVAERDQLTSSAQSIDPAAHQRTQHRAIVEGSAAVHIMLWSISTSYHGRKSKFGLRHDDTGAWAS